MSETLAYCGLICQTCPIYIASRIVDETERLREKTKIAKICLENYGIHYKPEDITDCDGCWAENDQVFSSCGSCEIRRCARQKTIENCALCEEYACDKLKAFFATEPNAKMRLDVIRGEK